VSVGSRMTGTAPVGVNALLTRRLGPSPIYSVAAPGVEKPAIRTHIRQVIIARVSGVIVLSEHDHGADAPAATQIAEPQITLYTSAICGYCMAAKAFLKSKGLQWTEVRIDTDPAQREKMIALAKRTSVPQIFVGQTHVGGYDDMMALHRAGKFEPLLAEKDA